MTALKQGFLFADDLYFTSELPERTDYGEEASSLPDDQDKSID